jgi:von Willebrand factor type A domain
MENNINNSFIEIHNNSSSLPKGIVNENEYFGVLNVEMKKTEVTQRSTYLHFSIDKSGSMSEGMGNSSKMNYVKQTFVNMVKYFVKIDANIYIQVNTFNDEVSGLIDCVKITYDNLDEIIQKIRDISPDGCTNIEDALNSANKSITEYSKKFSDHQVAHIFMTDGYATKGIDTDSLLCHLVSDEFTNIFVGFGYEHNLILLRKLSEIKNAEYQFVNNMENTALVYGEVIHKFIYPALNNVEFRINNGEIYDWQTNKWTNVLKESVIVSEAKKMYHIKTTSHESVSVHIYSEERLLESVSSIPFLLNIDTNQIIDNNLTIYAFRQKVQELLFSAKDSNKLNESEKITFKKHLRDLFRNIRKYMRENNMQENGLLKMLCDDIVIMYRSLSNRYGNMFVLARHTTQGRQQTYNTTPTSYSGIDPFIQFDGVVPPTPMRPPRMTRQTTATFRMQTEVDDDLSIGSKSPTLSLRFPSEDINDDTFRKYHETGFVDEENTETVFRSLSEDSDNEYIAEDEIESYIPSNGDTTCFATPSVLRTMREVSQTHPTNPN